MTTVFSPFAVATEPLYSLRLSYLTDISRSDNGTEQRVQCRIVPRREVSYLARTLQAYRTGWLDGLTYGQQVATLAVPYWPHGTHLLAAVTAGSARVLSVDTTDRDFVAGGYAVLWSDEGHTEEVTLTGVSSSTITATLANNWPAGTFVMPSSRGTFTGDFTTARIAAPMAEVPVTFTLEHGTDPGVETPTIPEVFGQVILRGVTRPGEASARIVVPEGAPNNGVGSYAQRTLTGLDPTKGYTLEGYIKTDFLPCVGVGCDPNFPGSYGDGPVNLFLSDSDDLDGRAPEDVAGVWSKVTAGPKNPEPDGSLVLWFGWGSGSGSMNQDSTAWFDRFRLLDPSGTVVFSEDFNYADTAALLAAWPFSANSQTGATMSLDATSLQVYEPIRYIRRDVTHSYERMVDRLEVPTRSFVDYARRKPIGSRPLKVWLASRASVNALIAWFEGLKGALTAFWLPTYQQDLDVLSGLGTSSLTIKRCGYTTNLFPNPERKHLAAIAPTGTITHCTVTASVDNGLATGTETLTLDVAAPVGSMVGFLLYGRLASDTLEIRWRTNGFAECEFQFVECPGELAA